MRVLTILLLTTCLPAYAGGHDGAYIPTVEYSFPTDYPLYTTEDEYTARNAVDLDGPPLYLRIIDRYPEHYADVVFHNELVSGFYTHQEIFFERPDGRVIHVRFDTGDGSIPDIMVVVPPPGFRAVPPEITVEEHTTVVVEIHEELLG